MYLLVNNFSLIPGQFLHRTVNNTPDLYLDELHKELQDICGVSVSLSTVWRTLVKGGYSMKKVQLSIIVFIVLLLIFLSTANTHCYRVECRVAKHIWSSHWDL